jgi:long-chain acyl-CoA synthetase
VKRWAVLANDLSIEAGDLTANLKLKRQAIVRRMGDVLESLYNGMKPSPAILYIGQAVKG